MKLAIVVFDGLQARDVAVALDMLAAANEQLPPLERVFVALVGETSGSDLARLATGRTTVAPGSSEASSTTCRRRAEDSFIERVRAYVVEHIGERLSVSQLAAAMAVSRRTLSRTFGKEAEVTPAAFVAQLRVERSRTLLEQTDLPMKTVAFRCGFQSASHMRTAFARHLVTTPREYRRRLRGESGARGDCA